MDGWMDEWMDEWMDDWMDGWMDGKVVLGDCSPQSKKWFAKKQSKKWRNNRMLCTLFGPLEGCNIL